MGYFKIHEHGGLCNHGNDGVLSLAEAACLKLTNDVDMTKRAIKTLPQCLFPLLLASTLQSKTTACTKAVVASWPLTVLSFKSFQQYTCNLCKFPRVEESVYSMHDDYALAIAEAMSENTNLQIQDVNLTELRISKEAQTKILELLIKGRQNGEEAVGESQHTGDGKGDKGWKELRVMMDLSVESSSSAEQFFERQQQMRDVNMGLRSNELFLSDCKTEEMEEMLTRVDNTDTTGMNFFFLSSDLPRIFPLVQNFKKLTELSLPFVSLNEESRSMHALKSMLSNLPALEYLDLSYTHLNGQLSGILSCIKQPLLGLNVTGCWLGSQDLVYLAHSHHAPCLQHLLLSENRDVAQHWGEVELLLRAVSGSLLELDLTRARLQQYHALRLAELGVSFQRLRSLEVQINPWISSNDLVDVVLGFVKCPTMSEMRISLDTKCMIDTVDDMVGQRVEFSSNSETTVLPWFALTCLKERREMICGQKVYRRPMTVYIYGKKLQNDGIVGQFQIA